MKRAKKKKNFNQLLILDDITYQLKHKEVEEMLKKLSMNRRHLRLSIILLVQHLRSIPMSIRFQITDIVYFKPSNELDAEILNAEFIGMNKKEFNKLKEFVWDGQHEFIMINKNNNKMYKNLQRIIFN